MIIIWEKESRRIIIKKKKEKKLTQAAEKKKGRKKWRVKSRRNVTKLLISRRDDFRSILTGVAR